MRREVGRKRRRKGRRHLDSWPDFAESFAGWNLARFGPAKEPFKDPRRNSAKTDKGQDFCSRRFGHKAVRYQMPQTCASRSFLTHKALWSIFCRCQSPFSSLFPTTSSAAGLRPWLDLLWHRKLIVGIPRFFARLFAEIFAGSNSARFDPVKDSAK